MHLPDDFDAAEFAALAHGFQVDDSTYDKTLWKKFPVLKMGILSCPGIVVDGKGRVLVWYLPKVVPESLTVSDTFKL